MKFIHLGLVALFHGLVRAVPAPVLPQPYTAFDKRAFNLNQFLAKIVELFPVNVTVTDICGALTAGEQVLGSAFGLQSTQNSNGCADVTIVFARGTCDPGNVGTLVGPPIINAIKSAIGSSKSVTVQGVPYPASVDGYLKADPTAGHTMAGIITKTLSSCPNTELVLGGYSQGGYAVHNAANNLDAGSLSKVKAVVIFGDPMSKQPVNGINSSRVRVFCHEGDNICDAGPIVTPQHLTYAVDGSAAAAFVVSNL